MKSRRYSRKSVKTGKFRSELESKVSEYLTKKKLCVTYEDTKLGYVVMKNYIPDFKITKSKKVTGWGDYLFLEVKGYFPSSDRTKMLAVKKTYPYVDLRIIFQRDNFLSKKSKTKYSDWAKKNGFPYHVIGNSKILVPKDWLQ